MYVQDINRTKNPSDNAFSTLTHLNCVLKVFALHCISRDGQKLYYSWPICKVAFTTSVFLTINSLSIYFSLKTTSDNPKARFHDYVPVIYLLEYLQYIVDLTFVYKYGRQRCLNYYSVFDNIDRVIGMYYYNEIKKSVGRICIFFIFIGSFYIVSDIFALIMAYGSIAAIHSIEYIFTIIKMVSVLDSIAQFIQIKYRFKRMEDILHDYHYSLGTLPGVTKDVICKKDWTKTVCNKRLHLLSTIGYNRSNIIFNLSKCYLLLLEQCDYINGMYGLRILLGGLVYLLEMVVLINLIIKLIIGTMVFSNQASWLYLIATAMKIVNSSSILLCGIYCCEQNYKHTEGIIRCIDHLLANKKLTMEVQEVLKELRELIITRPVCFNAVNFYTLNYPTMLSLASAVVTYTIILLQNMQ